jgi:hypothetical protein
MRSSGRTVAVELFGILLLAVGFWLTASARAFDNPTAHNLDRLHIPSSSGTPKWASVPFRTDAIPSSSILAADSDDRYWDPQFGPPTGDTLVVQAIVTKGDSIVIGGYFRTLQGIPVNSLALWDGSRWKPLVTGGALTTTGQAGNITALALAPNGDLYIAGQFARIGNVAASNLVRYDWQTVQPLPATLSGGIAAMTFIGNDLYVGGAFRDINGVAGTQSIARWDGTQWYPLGSGVDDGNVSALFAVGNDLYVGGSFSSVSGVAATAIARWDGTQWHAMGDALRGETPNVTPQVFDIDMLASGQIVIGGEFYRSGSRLVRYLAVWDGQQWQEIGPPDGVVTAVAVKGSNLYISGGFETVGGSEIFLAAWWDGSQWRSMGGDQLNSTMMVLQPTPMGILGGGGFDASLDNGFTLRGLALWNGSAWVGMGGNRGNGMDGTIFALASDDAGSVYALGTFNRAGPVAAPRMARFTGTRWEAISGLPFNNQQRTFHAMTRYRQGTLAVAAVFNLNAQAVSAVLQYDLTSSSYTQLATVGGSINARSIFALTYDAVRDRLYCGGNFLTLNGDTVRGIAVFDGQRWASMGGGISSGQINAIAVLPDGSVVAAGNFSTIGGESARSIARWDGNRWRALSDGIALGSQQGTVYALWVEGRSLYVAGNFDRAGSLPCANIARWDLDRAEWESLGGGTDGTIYALASYGNQLIVGGSFTRAGDTTASLIARYDPQSGQWYRMGSGLGGSSAAVRAMTVAGGALCVGGSFATAGGRASASFARWLTGISSVEDERHRPELSDVPLVLFPQPLGENTVATAVLRLPHGGQLVLDAFTLDGRRLGQLWSGILDAGEHRCTFDIGSCNGAVMIVAELDGRPIGWTLAVR